MGRQLDAVVAKALEYKVEYGLLEYPEGEDFDYWVYELKVRLPYYSTDGNAMLELDKEMRERGWYYTISHTTDLVAPFMATYSKRDGTEDNPTRVADTEPLARALAAYKALTGRDWSVVKSGTNMSLT